MKAVSVASGFARRWTAAYTIGLPAEERDRRREEIASDLWEQQHDKGEEGRSAPSAASVAGRVVLGMPADLRWRSAALRKARRIELMNLAVNPTLDLYMRRIGRAGLVAGIVFSVTVGVGLPIPLAVALVVAVVAMQLRQRGSKETRIVTKPALERQRRTRAIVVAAAVAMFAVGIFIDGLPSETTHDKYWALFVAPAMIAFMVGVVALPMLVWSWLPRRDGPDGDLG